MRKVRPKTGLQYDHLLHDNAPAHKSTDSKEGGCYIYALFFRNSGPLVQIAVPKGQFLSFGSFYKNLNKNEKSIPKTGLQHDHLLHDNAPAHKSSTVARFLKSEKVSVLSHPPCSPAQTWPRAIFPLSEIEKKI